MQSRKKLYALLCALLLTILCNGTGYADTHHPPCTDGGQHEFESHILLMNSEEAEGQVENICTICGYTYIERLPATGHQYGEWKTVEERLEAGIRIERRECQECHRGESRTVKLPSLTEGQENPPEEDAGPNQMDYILSTSIGGVWGVTAAALWYNGLVLNWYKRESMKVLRMR